MRSFPFCRFFARRKQIPPVHGPPAAKNDARHAGVYTTPVQRTK